MIRDNNRKRACLITVKTFIIHIFTPTVMTQPNIMYTMYTVLYSVMYCTVTHKCFVDGSF